MSSPGWYPDPSGQPNSFRFWDGQAWSQQTTDNPYAPPPGAQGYPAQPEQPGDFGATQMAPQQQPEPTTPEQWGQEPTQVDQPPVQAWGQQPEQPAQSWGQQPEQPAQQWGATAGAEQWQQGGQQQWGEQQGAPQQWGEQQQWGAQAGAAGAGAAAGAAGGAGGWGGGQQEWSPMPGDGGGGGSKKGLWIVLAGVLAIVLIVGGIFAAMALTGDDKDDDKSDDASTSEPTDEPSDDLTDTPTDEPTDAPSDDLTDAPTETDSPDDALPTAPVADFCTSGDPTSRESYPEDGNLYGGGLSSAPIRGYEPPPYPIAEVYTFAEDVGVVYREVQKDKWMSVQALGALDKEDAGSDLEAAAEAVLQCMADSPDFYQDLAGTKELVSEAIQIDGRDAWRMRWEIRVADPSVTAGGDVAEVVVVDTGDEDDYGLYAGVAPLDDPKLIDRMAAVAEGLTVTAPTG